MSFTDLQSIDHAVHACTNCALSEQRTKAVPGEGASNAGIMFIGEGPGYHEDRQGRPFVGPAGQLLDKLLASIGLKRADVYITNMVKCRPPSNRDPFPGEIQACSGYLDAQVKLIAPRVIVTLGRHSFGRFFPSESISKARGKARTWKGQTIFPIYHPAAAGRTAQSGADARARRGLPEAEDDAGEQCCPCSAAGAGRAAAFATLDVLAVMRRVSPCPGCV